MSRTQGDKGPLGTCMQYGSDIAITLGVHISVREVFFGFARHLEFFAGHLIEFNSSSSPDILKIRRTCQASPANFAYTITCLKGSFYLGIFVALNRMGFVRDPISPACNNMK